MVKPKIAALFIVTSIAVVTLAAMAMNLYVDIQIPIVVHTVASVEHKIPGFVYATGTWQRFGKDEGHGMVDPIQASIIHCDQDRMECTEAKSYIGYGKTLGIELVTYPIRSWNDDAITFESKMPCSIEIFTIDLKTESAAGSGKAINEGSPTCKQFPMHDSSWSYRLVNGLPIYLAERQKARPKPLKLIHTFFGS